jgi:hypothetical protein
MMDMQLLALSKKNSKTLLDIQELPEWFDIKNYQSNQLDLEGWIVQLYLRRMIQGFLLPIVLTGVVDDYYPKLNTESPKSPEAIQPISLHDAVLITEALKNSVHIPTELWQAPSHFAFFAQRDNITDTTSILSWFHNSKGNLPPKDSYLIEHTHTYPLRSFFRADLTAPDSVLFASFKCWLANERKLFSRQKVPKFSKATLQRWAVNQVLPFIDLTHWADRNNKQIPYWLMGKILFPEYSQGDNADRVRKTTEKTAKEITTGTCLQAMGAQLAAQTGKVLDLHTLLEEFENLSTKFKVPI